LATDEALLVYLATANETWFWVVRDDAAELYRSELGAGTLAAEIEALRASVTPDFDPYPGIEAFDLYRKLLAPAAPQLAGAHRLIVVPDGALQSLPLAILVTRRPEHDPKTLEDHRAIAWLARDYAVTVLPAVSSLSALRRGRPEPNRERAVSRHRRPGSGRGSRGGTRSCAGQALPRRGCGRDPPIALTAGDRK
jgi:CHAT domain-containing protein